MANPQSTCCWGAGVASGRLQACPLTASAVRRSGHRARLLAVGGRVRWVWMWLHGSFDITAVPPHVADSLRQRFFLFSPLLTPRHIKRSDSFTLFAETDWKKDDHLVFCCLLESLLNLPKTERVSLSRLSAEPGVFSSRPKSERKHKKRTRARQSISCQDIMKISF